MHTFPPARRTSPVLAAVLATLAAALAAAPAAMAAPADKEVLAAQDVWKQALMKKDRALFEKILHPDLSYGHSSGAIETKAQAIEHVMKTGVEYTAIAFTDTKVKVQGNTALVTGKVDYHQKGKDKTNVINLVVLSVWVKGPQGWQLLARQSTRPTPPAGTPTAAK
jgi:ketosteroid isomerase-like protein